MYIDPWKSSESTTVCKGEERHVSSLIINRECLSYTLNSADVCVKENEVRPQQLDEDENLEVCITCR